MTESATDGDTAAAVDESPLTALRDRLEWNCNETNNHHCRIVTALDADDHSPLLRVWLRTDNRGEYVNSSGYDSVLRQIYHFEMEHDVLVTNVDPDTARVLVRESPQPSDSRITEN